jgi:signal transduction histidine kinase
MHRSSLQRTGNDRWLALAVLAGLTAFVVGVYVVVVVGGGALIGRTESPSIALSVVATAIVALALGQVRRRLESAIGLLFQRSGSSPYDILSRFSETVTGGYATEELPGRMVQLLATGTNAEWAQVWLTVQGRLVLAASSPPDAGKADLPPEPGPDGYDTTGDGRRAITVRHGGRVYGVFRLQERDSAPLSSVEERLFTGLAAQAGLVLRLAGLRAELAARHDELAARTAELQLSRERLIAAQDEERRRLERNIHDGAQQHLVALAVNLRLVETVAAKDPERAADLVATQADAARAALETLSRLASGMYPPHLADAGLAIAIRNAVAASPVPVIVSDQLTRRDPEPVEAALYFFAMEAIQNAAKHAAASSITVDVSASNGETRVTVVDDGSGFVVPAQPQGCGLLNMRDRIDAIGGVVSLDSSVDRGTCVSAAVPVQREGVVV